MARAIGASAGSSGHWFPNPHRTSAEVELSDALAQYVGDWTAQRLRAVACVAAAVEVPEARQAAMRSATVGAATSRAKAVRA